MIFNDLKELSEFLEGNKTNKDKFIPLVLFTYNRLEHTKNTIDSLLKNKEAKDTDLYIFSDSWKNTKDKKNVIHVRDYLKTITGFKNIILIFRSNNNGLANSIIKSLNVLFNYFDKLIISEDDLIYSNHYLHFMNAALNHYSPKEVWSVGAYSPIKANNYSFSTYLMHRNCSWGWGSWAHNWNKTDWDVKDFNSFITNREKQKRFEQCGNDVTIMLLKQMTKKINSWSIRFNYSGFINNLPSVYPSKSLVQNIGADGSGTNMKSNSKYKGYLSNERLDIRNMCPTNVFDSNLTKQFKRFFDVSIIRLLINKTKIILYKI